MRAVDAGQSFIVTRNGVPVGELIPFPRRGFVSKATVVAAFAQATPIDLDRFRDDLDSLTNEDPTPRG